MPLYLAVKEFRVKVKSDTSLSPMGSNVFADQSCVVTAQVGALQNWETLTERLFEHWLNISQSYKKQHGGYKRGSLNQILYTAGTFRFFPCRLVDFSPLCPCRLNCAGFGLQRHQWPKCEPWFQWRPENHFLWRTWHLRSVYFFLLRSKKNGGNFILLYLFEHVSNMHTPSNFYFYCGVKDTKVTSQPFRVLHNLLTSNYTFAFTCTEELINFYGTRAKIKCSSLFTILRGSSSIDCTLICKRVYFATIKC